MPLRINPSDGNYCVHYFQSGFARASGGGNRGEDEKLRRKGPKGEVTDREKFYLELSITGECFVCPQLPRQRTKM